MAYQSRIWPDHRLHVLSFSGRLNAAIINEATAAYFASSRFSPDQNQIIDLTAVDDYDLGFSSLMSVIRFKVPYMAKLDRTVRYVLLSPTETDFGMARMYQQMTDSHYAFGILTARSWPEAMRLVGIDADSPDALS